MQSNEGPTGEWTLHGLSRDRYPGGGKDLSFEGYTLNESTSKPPLGIYEAMPIFGKRVPTWSMEIQSEKELSVVITQVYNFRDAFEAEGALLHVQP